MLRSSSLAVAGSIAPIRRLGGGPPGGSLSTLLVVISEASASALWGPDAGTRLAAPASESFIGCLCVTPLAMVADDTAPLLPLPFASTEFDGDDEGGRVMRRIGDCGPFCCRFAEERLLGGDAAAAACARSTDDGPSAAIMDGVRSSLSSLPRLCEVEVVPAAAPMSICMRGEIEGARAAAIAVESAPSEGLISSCTARPPAALSFRDCADDALNAAPTTGADTATTVPEWLCTTLARVDAVTRTAGDGCSSGLFPAALEIRCDVEDDDCCCCCCVAVTDSAVALNDDECELRVDVAALLAAAPVGGAEPAPGGGTAVAAAAASRRPQVKGRLGITGVALAAAAAAAEEEGALPTRARTGLAFTPPPPTVPAPATDWRTTLMELWCIADGAVLGVVSPSVIQ